MSVQVILLCTCFVLQFLRHEFIVLISISEVSVAGIEQLASDLLPSRQFGHLVLLGPQC